MNLKNKTASICACAKNVAEHLPLSISKIEMISSVFKEVKIFMFENDSTDDTLSILKDWAKKNQSVKIISERNLIKTRSHCFLHRLRYFLPKRSHRIHAWIT